MPTPTPLPTPTPEPLPEGWSRTSVASVYPSIDAAQKAPIPKGFVASSATGENNISNGLVIYEGTTTVTDANHETAMTTRNQYVWIPVANINDMVMCKSRTDSSECDIGFVNGELKCKNHSATAKDLCGRLYDPCIDGDNPTLTNGKYIFSGTMANTKAGQTWNTSDRHEPNLVTNSDVDTTAARNQIESDFYSMAESVATYGGFYIARYEAQANASSKKAQAVITAATNNNMWYGLYGTLRRQIKNGSTTTLVGQMIWGCEYDQVIKFIGADAQTGHIYQNISSANSGANSSDKLKNIYDLEGNMVELTAETYSNYSRSERGGDYYYAGSDNILPASNCDIGAPGNTSSNESSRQALYVPLRASDGLDGAGSISLAQ